MGIEEHLLNIEIPIVLRFMKSPRIRKVSMKIVLLNKGMCNTPIKFSILS